MKRQIEALNLVWPKGIPPHEYEKALRLVGTYSTSPATVLAPSAPAQAAKHVLPEGVVPLEPRKVYVGQAIKDKVSEVLTTGPATCTEISQAIGVDAVRVNQALHLIGAKVIGTKARIDGRFGARPRVWALPEKK